MKVDKDTVVAINYELLAADGELIERSSAPVEYLHGGYAGMFPLVEEALQGQEAGAEVTVRLEAPDAFGEYDDSLRRSEPRAAFPKEVAVGMQFEGTGADSGETRVYTVTAIGTDSVDVDGNHPLAGRALDFRCTVVGVRDATHEELAHGHVHGPGGHHH